MSDAGHSPEHRGSSEGFSEDLEHPRGTLVIVILFGVLLGLGWLSMYLFLFLERGGLRP